MAVSPPGDVGPGGKSGRAIQLSVHLSLFHSGPDWVALSSTPCRVAV